MAPVQLQDIRHNGGMTFGSCLYNEVGENQGKRQIQRAAVIRNWSLQFSLPQ